MTYEVTVKNIKLKHQHETHFDDDKITKWLVVNKEKIEGEGFFNKPFIKINKEDEGLMDGVSFCNVYFRDANEDNIDRNYNLVIHLLPHDSYDRKFDTLQLDFNLDADTNAVIKDLTKNRNANLVISFKVIEWINNDDSYGGAARAIVTRIDNSMSYSKYNDATDYKIIDIENYLIRKNCFNSRSGQVAEICKEFAKSFRSIPSNVNINDLLDEINSFISSCRGTFHDHLNKDDEAKIKSYNQKYDFVFNTYSKDYGEEFNKITDKREHSEAVRIFNHLWSTRKAENMFRDGFPIGSGDAEHIANEYLELKHVFSPTCERILIDVLISCDIGEYASSAQFNNNISANALLSIPHGHYKSEPLLAKNKTGKQIILEFIFTSITGLIGRLISGLISWWISGLIAGDNDTAHIVLFGTMFAADTVLLGLYQNSKLKDEEKVGLSKEEHYFNIIRKMCNLHDSAYYMDTKLMRSMLHQLTSSNVQFQHKVFQLLSLIEAR